MPIALLLVIPPKYGGDSTAQELVNRFELLHHESANFIDFYFLGWQWNLPGDPSGGITFNLKAFETCRQTLKKLGVTAFGGNADLYLIDTYYSYDPSAVAPTRITINFGEAIHIDLSLAQRQSEIVSVGDFLQSLIAAAEATRESLGARAGARAISNQLGMRTAGQSIVAFVLERWGRIIGAPKLARLCVRNIGPEVGVEDLADLSAVTSSDAR